MPYQLGRTRLAVAAAAASAALCTSGVALAQLDTNPPLPNVILALDSSGSMNRMANGNLPATCDPKASANSDLNKWHTLQTVLTGTVNNRGCYALDRSTGNFWNEFSLQSKDPYDYGYALPFYRLVSNNCVIGAGTLPTPIWDFDVNASVKYHKYDAIGTSCLSTDFVQGSDGLLDVYRDRIRFSLMTFDALPDAGTGVNSGSLDAPSGFAGNWSYFLNWNGGGSAATGYPPGCSASIQEVGARNQGAPPWEGRMIAPGKPDATIDDIRNNNDQIQLAVLAARPYGATPLAGMMTDISTFLHDDKSKDPLNPLVGWGPASDPYFNGGCRQTYVLLFSDGDPNLDLRPSCEASGGKCPFKKPWEVAHDLYQWGDPKTAVKTFTIHMGPSTVGGTDCKTLQMPADFDPGGKCYNATGQLASCCAMQRIAYEGGTTKSYFANDITSLKAAISNVLSQVVTGTTSRTIPVFGSTIGMNVVNSQAPAVAYQFTSSFNVTLDGLWTANLERHRWQCRNNNGVLKPERQDFDPARGDDFVANINTGKNGTPRKFITVLANQDISKGKGKGKKKGTGGGNNLTSSFTTIRPFIGADDGAGVVGGTTYTGDVSFIATTLAGSPKAMDLVPMPKQCQDPLLNASSAGDCARRLMTWLLGGTNTGCTTSNDPCSGSNQQGNCQGNNSGGNGNNNNNGNGGGTTIACPTRSGKEIGAIRDSTPAMSTPPVAHIRDADYDLFAVKWAKRPIMLYSATTDGQVHAHKVAPTDPTDSKLVDTLQNNELWSFVPTFALPDVLGIYYNIQDPLLDGAIQVKDMILERTISQAQGAGTAAGSPWSTILVVGGGAAGGFYEALDVTDPYNPVFLWQLADTSQGEPMFGARGATPTLATIALKDNGAIKETAVAILVGGGASQVKQKTCQKLIKQQKKSNKYTPRTNGKCWADGPEKSLFVVRVKDGKILRVLGADKSQLPSGFNSSVFTQVNFDAPLTGIPVAYPNLPGEVANTIYIGDADGVLQRVNVTDPDPANWYAETEWDAYPFTTDNPLGAEDVETAPIIAVDDVGNRVITFSTGDQQLLQFSAGMKNRIWSITETPNTTQVFDVKENWYLNFDDGKRVTGPITIFDGVTYFSTYTPAAATDALACTAGYGSVWGVSYKDSQDLGAGPQPLPRLPKDPNANNLTFVSELKQAAGTVVYGVSVQMQPPCFDDSVLNTSYAGQHNAITNSTVPTYSLMFHTGSAGTVYGGAAARSRATNLGLATPRQMLRFDSWASVAE